MDNFDISKGSGRMIRKYMDTKDLNEVILVDRNEWIWIIHVTDIA